MNTNMTNNIENNTLANMTGVKIAPAEEKPTDASQKTQQLNNSQIYTNNSSSIPPLIQPTIPNNQFNYITQFSPTKQCHDFLYL